MKIDELFKGINLQKVIIDKIIPIIAEKEDEFNQYINDLIDFDKSEKTYEALCKIYDWNSFEMLSIYLLSCLKIYDKYQLLGINDDIFFDTMKCFTRFIDECYVKTGKYYFDRSWWTYRQVRMSEFRIGILEYEFDLENNVVSIHIPSDAKLNKDNIEKSIKNANEFINKYYKEYSNFKMVCDSWLLSPKLKLYLNDNSNILLFQSYFNIISFEEDDYGYIEWLFKENINFNIINFKEDTSLQRKVKKALLNGEKIGCAYGILK